MFAPLARLFVEIGAVTKPFDDAMSRLQGRLSGMTRMRMGLGGGLGFGLAMRGVDGLFAGLQHVLKAGSELNEATNKLGVIFGDQAKVVGASADRMAEKYGVVRKQYIDMASEYGNLLQGMGGQTRQEAAEMSNVLASVAADATSLFDAKDFGEAAAKLASGLRGLSLPMSKYGVDTQKAAVVQEALRLGLARTSSELTTHDKVVARTSIMLREMGYAGGDLDNTMTSYANATRAARGRTENLAATVGQQILPAFESMADLLNEVLVDMTTSVDGMTTVFEDFANFVKDAVETLGIVYRNWGSIVDYVGVEILQSVTNVGEIFTWLQDVIGEFLAWFGANWSDIIIDALNMAATAIFNFYKYFWNLGLQLGESLASGFRTQVDWTFPDLFEGIELRTQNEKVMPELHLSSFAEEYEKVMDRVQRIEQAHTDRIAAQMRERQPRGQRQATGGERPAKAEGFEITSLAESWKKIQTSIKPDRTPQQIAANTAQVVREVQQSHATIQENARLAKDQATKMDTLNNHLKKIQENTAKRQAAVAG